MNDTASTSTALADSWSVLPGRRDVVIADGEEAASYLNGQVSQDINGLAVGTSAWTLVLSPQGRIDAWARVTRVGEQLYWLDVETGVGQQLLDRLDRFKLRTKVTFELVDMAMIAVRGPLSPEPTLLGPAGVDAAVGWANIEGFDRIGPDVEMPDGAIEGAPETFEALRIRSGMPTMGAEILEKTIPAEVGVVEASADFTKGCYVGQELVARIDSRGNNTPRRIWGVTIAEGRPSVGDPVLIAGEPAGTITSVASDGNGGAVALASIIRAAEVPGPATVSGAEAAVVALPMAY